MPSKRGGGSAPGHCKTALRSCMVGGVHRGGSLRSLSKGCMSTFNSCRSKRKGRKAKGRKTRRR